MTIQAVACFLWGKGNIAHGRAPFNVRLQWEMNTGEKVTLIVGGLDRGVDWAPYMRRIGDHCPLAVIGLPDNGPKILQSLERARVLPEFGLHRAAALEQALAVARSLTPAGGVVLLSPGAPSFPRYRDYRERGRHFAELCGFEPDMDEGFDGE